MSDYPPYVDAYGSLPKLFDAIVKAAVPSKFTQDFIGTILGLKSTSYRAMIPLLKRLGFIDQANVPTEAYKKYRDDSQSKAVMATQIIRQPIQNFIELTNTLRSLETLIYKENCELS